MFTGAVLWSLLFAGGSAFMDARQAAAPIDPTCRIIEAAYTAAIGSDHLAYPRDIDPSIRVIDLTQFVPDYRKRLAMNATEFNGLAARQSLYAQEKYRPLCMPVSDPAPRVDEEGHLHRVSFTHPIVSANGMLAITEVSFQEPGGARAFGYGMMCVVRRGAAGWTAKCVDSWVT
ncbi:hypothetical protein TPR58_20585 [Sphingomonas sp. HF-S3]|uniref:Uncharacterized protein n=1 Tax=Sphingomonas rustica TaxID=3103142 RepID=A0ABV0BDG3_9SPHN